MTRENLELSRRREEDPLFTVLSTLLQLNHVLIGTVDDTLITYSEYGLSFYSYESFDGPLYYKHSQMCEHFPVDIPALKEEARAWVTGKKKRPFGM